MTAEKRRSRGLLAAIVDDPLRKLIAIGLAVLLWFFIDSRITSEHVRTLPLVTVGAQSLVGEGQDRLAVVLPTDQVVGKGFFDGERRLDRVEVVIRGPRFRVAEIANEPLNLQVTAFLGLDWTQRNAEVFTAGDLRRDQRVLQDLRIELRPSRIRLDVERIEARKIPLTLDLVEIDDGGFGSRLRRDTADFAPDEATVLGPAIGIERFSKRPGKPFRVSLQAAGSDRQVTGSLELVGAEDLGIRFAATPILTMQVNPLTEPFDVELPILVDDLTLPAELRSRMQPETTTRMTRIRVAGNLRIQLSELRSAPNPRELADFAAANLRLYVSLPPGTTLPAELDREARLMFVGRGYQQVGRNECLLDETVVVKLRQKP